MKNYFKNLFTVSTRGRVTRSEYFLMTFLTPLLSFVLTMILISCAISINDESFTLFIIIFIMSFMFYASLIMTFMSIKRLHDTNKSGIYIIVNMAPIIGPLVYLYYMLEKGNIGPNTYGADPRQIQ